MSSPTPNLVTSGSEVLGTAGGGVKFPTFPLLSIDFLCRPFSVSRVLIPLLTVDDRTYPITA